MRSALGGLVMGAVLAIAATAAALPVELRDSNGTRYHINTAVNPLLDDSTASGAITDATYTKPVTVTSYWIGFTPFFGFTTVYTVQYKVDIPLTNAFNGFNGLLVSAVNGVNLPNPIVFNTGEGLLAEDCPQNGKNRQLTFQTQNVPAFDLALTRKVFVPNNDEFARWLNVVTNTGTTERSVTLTLRGLLGSGSNTRVTSTSTGGSSVSAADNWFATAQQTPANNRSLQPRMGFVVQGDGAPSRASIAIGSQGQTVFNYPVTLAPGASALLLTYVTVQGSSKHAKKVAENVVTLPSKAIACMTQNELAQVVNFAPLTVPVTKNAQIKLNFKKQGKDEITWKGTVNVGAGIPLTGIVITVDVGGATGVFTLNKQGKSNLGGGNKLHLNANLKQGVTKAGDTKFNFTLKGDFQGSLASYGLTNATAKNVPVAVPVTFTVTPPEQAARGFGTTQAFTWKATEGKSGTAKSQ
ncbi:MAG: hypothetical protein KIT14_02475 [bacterium]|nr:hypothetical protein [bacterium]